MGIIKKLRRHAAMASGNFSAMFKGVEIPPLPLAIQRLMSEINKENPDLDELVKLISSATGIASKVIQTVNSSYYSPRSPVTQIRQAVMFLGVKNIRSLAMAFTAMEAIAKPKGKVFDHEAFWLDSLLRAFLSRRFAATLSKEAAEEAFTASLISDIALPVLLSIWGEYYTPIIMDWMDSPKHLSELEREQFGWDHAQASAWIVQSWGFPDELVCYISAHNLTMDKIQDLELEDTIVVPMMVAAQASSILKQDARRNQAMFEAAIEVLGIFPGEFVQMITSVDNDLREVLSLFGLSDRGAHESLAQIAAFSKLLEQERDI